MANLTFKSIGPTKLALNKIGSPNTTTIQYSLNDGTWTNYTFGSEITLYNNEYVAFSGNAKFSKNIQNRYNFSTSGTGTLFLSGDLTSLVSATTVEDDYEFNSLFSGCANIVDAADFTLPSNTTNWCFANMFFGCTTLTAAPTFVATEIKSWAYANMFVKCFALKTPPTLPTPTLNDHAYSNMFQNCTSLTSVTNMYNLRNAPWMYNAMYEGCISVNPLPMFPYGSLGVASSNVGIFSNMYRKCNNITIAPLYEFTRIPPKTMNFMYDGAKNVNAVEVTFEQWPTGISAATSCWLKDVSPTGTFVGPSALTQYIKLNQQTSPDLFPPEDWQILSYQTMPLTFRAISQNVSGTVRLVEVNNPSGINLHYRKNHTGNWNYYSVGNTITLGPGECVSFSGSTANFSTIASGATPAFYRFQTSGAQMFLYGKLTSLANNANTLEYGSEFAYLFAGCANIRDASRLYFPTNTTNYCYIHMFSGCTALIYPPKELPAKIVKQDSYRNMFNSCTSLRQSPQIRVTKANYGYSMNSMFYNCSSISAIWIDLESWPNEDYHYNALHSWTYGVPATGYFYKPSGLTQIFNSETGCYNRIPNGWTVYNH